MTIIPWYDTATIPILFTTEIIGLTRVYPIIPMAWRGDVAPPVYRRRETERNAFELTDEDINRYEAIMKQRPTGSHLSSRLSKQRGF